MKQKRLANAHKKSNLNPVMKGGSNMKPLTPEYTLEVLQQIESFSADAKPAKIEETAERLKSLNYQPMLLIDVPEFLKMTRTDLIRFIRNLTSQRKTDLTEQHLSLLLYHYRLLMRLRQNEAEAWDEVSELVEND